MTMLRRNLLQAGAVALAGGTALLRAATAFTKEEGTLPLDEEPHMSKEEVIRSYYSGWEKSDWGAIDRLLADGFTFTSPNHDDHIDKPAFKARCWSQKDWIKHFELESVMARNDEAFVKYLCHTKNGKSFRNTEYFRFRGRRIAAIECYFGQDLGFPSAASLGHR